MYIKNSRLWAVAMAISNFLGFGACHSGRIKLERIESDLEHGWSTKQLDQCNLRGWIVTDVVMTLVLLSIVGGSGLFFGTYILMPLVHLLFQTNVGAADPFFTTLAFVLVNIGLLLWHDIAKPSDRPAALSTYVSWVHKLNRGLGRLVSYLIGRPTGRLARNVSSGVGSVVSDVKSKVCTVYEVSNDTVRNRRAARFVWQQAFDTMDGMPNLLLVADHDDWRPAVLDMVRKSCVTTETDTDWIESVKWVSPQAFIASFEDDEVACAPRYVIFDYPAAPADFWSDNAGCFTLALDYNTGVRY